MSSLGQNSAVPAPGLSAAQIARGYGNSNPTEALPQSLPAQHAAAPTGKFTEDWDASQRGSSLVDSNMLRSNSVMSQGDTLIPTRGGTLKKKPSLKRGGSLKRSGSRRSSRAGSVRSLALHTPDVNEAHSAFHSPVPTSGNPTEVLANRFQGRPCHKELASR